MVDDDDPVGQLIGLLHVLRRQQDGHVAGGEPLDHLPERQPASRIESGGGLVQEEHGRRGDQAHGEVETAAHPARIGLHLAPGRVGELEQFEQVAGAVLGIGLAEAVEPPKHEQVLFAGQILVHRRVLAGEPNALAHLARLARYVVAVHERSAPIGREQRAQDANHRRLAGAVRTEQRQDAPAFHGEVYALEHFQVLERLAQPGDDDRVSPGSGIRIHGRWGEGFYHCNSLREMCAGSWKDTFYNSIRLRKRNPRPENARKVRCGVAFSPELNPPYRTKRDTGQTVPTRLFSME